jgi:hypothetical protein
LSVIYPDIESVLVAHFKRMLSSNIRVATKRLPAGGVQPEFQVVIEATWAGDKDPVMKYAGVQIHVYGSKDVETSILALVVEAHLRNATVGPIKHVRVLVGPVRLGEEAPLEARHISAEVTVLASDF